MRYPFQDHVRSPNISSAIYVIYKKGSLIGFVSHRGAISVFILSPDINDFDI
jgi:hypothetical protein